MCVCFLMDSIRIILEDNEAYVNNLTESHRINVFATISCMLKTSRVFRLHAISVRNSIFKLNISYCYKQILSYSDMDVDNFRYCLTRNYPVITAYLPIMAEIHTVWCG